MKSYFPVTNAQANKSPPAREVWIEIKVTYGLGEDYDRSPPAREVWIEISGPGIFPPGFLVTSRTGGVD